MDWEKAAKEEKERIREAAEEEERGFYEQRAKSEQRQRRKKAGWTEEQLREVELGPRKKAPQPKARHGSEGVQSDSPMSSTQGGWIIFLLACLVGFSAYHTVKAEIAEAEGEKLGVELEKAVEEIVSEYQKAAEKLERSFRGR